MKQYVTRLNDGQLVDYSNNTKNWCYDVSSGGKMTTLVFDMSTDDFPVPQGTVGVNDDITPFIYANPGLHINADWHLNKAYWVATKWDGVANPFCIAVFATEDLTSSYVFFHAPLTNTPGTITQVPITLVNNFNTFAFSYDKLIPLMFFRATTGNIAGVRFVMEFVSH